MRMNKLLVTLSFSMLFGSGLAVAASDLTWDEVSEIKTEPTLCYEASMLVFERMGHCFRPMHWGKRCQDGNRLSFEIYCAC
jgi:hypothetical protein